MYRRVFACMSFRALELKCSHFLFFIIDHIIHFRLIISKFMMLMCFLLKQDVARLWLMASITKIICSEF